MGRVGELCIKRSAEGSHTQIMYGRGALAHFTSSSSHYAGVFDGRKSKEVSSTLRSLFCVLYKSLCLKDLDERRDGTLKSLRYYLDCGHQMYNNHPLLPEEEKGFLKQFSRISKYIRDGQEPLFVGVEI